MEVFRGNFELGCLVKCKAGFELNLKKLKTLYVNTLDDDIQLNCPSLSNLSFYLVYPSFSRPAHYKQIRTLSCHFFHPWIKGLENLETLYCDMLFNYEHRSTDFLKCFPKLNSLYIYYCQSGYFSSIERDIAELKRNDLTVFHMGKLGTEFTQNDTVNQQWNGSNYDCGNLVALYYRNELTKLAPTLPTFTALHYDEIFRTYGKEFYQKLRYVQVLTIVQGAIPQRQIVEMVECLRSIVILMVMEGAHLDQSFYDRLPDRYPHLRWLQVDNSALEKLDLNFLFRCNDLYRIRFKKLKSVKTDPVYKKLAKKVGNKKKEITKINGDLLFEMDKFRLRIQSFRHFYMRRDWIASGLI